MPLTMANPGECYTIRKVGGKEETRRFLENLKDSRVAVGKDMAAKILI